MGNSIRFDDSRSPTVVVEFVRTPTDEEFDEYLSELTRRLGRTTPHVFVIDARVGAATAPQSRRQGEWMRTHYDAVKRLTQGMAFVSESGLVRLSLSIIFMIQRLPCDYVVTGSLDEALEWAAALDRRQLVGA